MGTDTAVSSASDREQRFAERLQKITLVIARIALGYLFFANLFWKFPPTFGCPSDFAFTTGMVENNRVKLERTSGLCDWVGIEAVWSTQPRALLVTDMKPIGGPWIGLPIGPLAQLNGLFLTGFVQPNIRWFGWVIWGIEAVIFVSLFFGLFTRLGGLVSIAQSSQLMIGLAGISTPMEWEWGYNLMVVLSLLVFAFAPGRIFGLDALIRPRLQNAAAQGNRLARIGLWLT